MTAATDPPLAVVVCSRDRPAMLAETLASLAKAVAPGDEVVVVDSASRTAETRRVAEAAGVAVVRCDRPGLSRARNAGVRATTASLIAFIDDDCLPDASWGGHVRRGFDDERVAFVTGRAVPDAPARMMLSVVVDETPKVIRPGDDLFAIGTGANMAFRREALEEIGGFDEALGAGGALPAGEDNDAWWRILRRGWMGRFVPEALVVHRQWRKGTDALRLEYRYGIGAGALAVKIRRLDGEGPTSLRDLLWRRGLAGAARALREGYESGALAALFRTAGVAVGALRSARRPLDAERFRA